MMIGSLNSAIDCSGHCVHGPILTSKCRHTRWHACLRASNRLTRHHSVSRARKCSNSPVGRALFVCSAKRDAKRVHQKQQTEQSKMAESELIYFMFQLNLDTQLQRMLNMDDFDTAQEIRKRRKQIDEIVAEQLEAKGPSCGTRSANQTAVADVASEGLRLRSELQRAIDEERYADAAEVRDRLKVVQGQSEQAQSEAENATSSVRKYELGQRVKHAKLGYDGVVCGWDNACCEGQDWQKAAGVADLQKGCEQTFYHLLVDAKDWEASWERPPVAYVAEELLDAPEVR
ncbi:TPA: hypothetical protein ACH3X2_005521 [Trebouxia sp. C0005]